MTRRQFLQPAVGAAGLPFAACAHHAALMRCPGPPSDFTRVDDFGIPAYRIGPDNGRTIVILHELPGLSPDDLALARCIAREGFRVYTPLLFGAPANASLEVGDENHACEIDADGPWTSRGPMGKRA